MIKVVIAFALGAACMLAYLAFGPGGTESRARVFGSTVVETATDARKSHCSKEFNERTHCYQDKNFTNKQCDILLESECGTSAKLPEAVQAKAKGQK